MSAGPRVLMLGMGWFPATVGGADRYFRSLLEQLPEARGVTVGPAGDAPSRVSIVSTQESPLPARLLSYLRAARRACREAELVDSHFVLYASLPVLLGALRGLPSVFHFQGPWALESVAAGDASRIRFAMRRRLERAVLQRADAHVVLSSAFRRLLIERYGIRPWDIHRLIPGVALERFTPGEAGSRERHREALAIEPDAFVAVCVRRLVARMGIDVLMHAWSEIADELPGGSQLLLIGDGPLRGELAERAAAEPLRGRVRVLGRVSDEQLVEAYRAADVAVVPSIAFEGFGLVVLEAAACGTPSIVTDVGGLPEVVAALDRSLVVPSEDASGLGARLRQAAHGVLPDAEATRAYAGSFSWPAVAERHRSLYRRVADRERDERPRVVFIDHIARLSGGEIALLRLLPQMRAVNAHVLLGEDGPLASRLQQAGISVEVLAIDPAARDLRRDTVRPGGLSPSAALSTLTYTLRLARRLRRLRPDLVHTNSLKSGVYGAIAARLAGVPVIWHARDRIAEDYIPRSAVRLVRALVGRLATALVANSTATLQTLPAFKAGAVRRVIPDSVEVSPLRHAPDPAHTTFGMLGRIAPWKGQELFLRAFAQAFPAGAERAVLVGSPMFGEEDYERELHALAVELGLLERVEFRGFREDIWRELASFDVLVHASVIPEPFGQVVIEGMAAGATVIAPDEGGPGAIVTHGHTGLLFQSRDVDSLAAAMRALREDPQLRERLARSALEAVVEYRPEAVAAQMQQLYEEVLRGRG